MFRKLNIRVIQHCSALLDLSYETVRLDVDAENDCTNTLDRATLRPIVAAQWHRAEQSYNHGVFQSNP